MPRRREVVKRDVTPDPKYGDVLLARFINYLMRRGKKSVAERIVYDAIDIMEDRTGQSGLEILKRGIENVKPVLEVTSRRVGGATYQVPIEVRQNRRTALAMRWILGYAKARAEKTMAEKLAAELMLAYKKEGPSIKKREDTHRMAEANKAFAHYRW
ncbi:MAG: 30S ribosomal protein S7 [Candidatus Krumholzibacteriota bacterium]|nr:30S ribosomal protein S7 [Candidatus Krumholzibacteriota bacterium]